MAARHDEQREALAAWLADPDVLEKLRRKDWNPAFATYPRLDLADEPIPWAQAPRRLADARLLLVSSSGIYAPGQQPFDDDNYLGDTSYRIIPGDVDLDMTRFAHEHYDHAYAMHDRNSVFPLGLLREMAARGEIGGLTPQHISFMGYQPDWRPLLDDFAPTLADIAVSERADAAILVPV